MIFGLYEEARYKEISSYRAGHYAQDANEAVKNACAGSVGRDHTICLQEKGAEARLQKHDNERNEADLVAQRKSALWTSIMGFAALIGMGLSAIGVYLVWTTFRATRDANDIARDTAKRQLRAYVVVTEMASTAFEEGKTPNFRVTLLNCGQTPATQLHLLANPFFFWTKDGPPPIRLKSEDIQSRMTLSPNKPHIIDDPLVHPLNKGQAGAINSGEMGIIYAGIVVYRDVFGRRRLTTFKTMFDHSIGPGGKWQAYKICKKGNNAS